MQLKQGMSNVLRVNLFSVLAIFPLISQIGLATVGPAKSIVIERTEMTPDPPVFLLQSLTLDGRAFERRDLATGTSTGVATAASTHRDITAADNFDLNDFAARNAENPPEWQITLIGGQATWSDRNGDAPDFFIFETGGNDTTELRAILPGEIFGDAVTVAKSSWGDTGYDRTGTAADPTHNGQGIFGLSFAVTDLLDDQGRNLTNSSVITGIQISSPGLDPCCFCAVSSKIVVRNDPPVVEAGQPQDIIWPYEKSVLLEGTATDDDPDRIGQLTVSWSMLSGPSGSLVFDDDAVALTGVTFPGPGTYELLLQAWDELAQEDSDTVIITVRELSCPLGDLDQDCRVRLEDLLIFSDYWLSADHAPSEIVGSLTNDMKGFSAISTDWLDSWTGSLEVTLSPEAAVLAGARWKVDQGPWYPGAFMETDLAQGEHLVTCEPISGWIEPKPQMVQISKDKSTPVKMEYKGISQIRLVISEFMASNSNAYADEQGQYDDWIELHNDSTLDVNVGGMFVTNDFDKPRRWQIPLDVPAQTTLRAGEYLVIWADEQVGQGPLHANFDLSAEGGRIGLFLSDGKTRVDDLTYDNQVPNISCGRLDTTSGTLHYFRTATAGQENRDPFEGKVADTRFSHDRGFFEDSFSLVITCATEGATVVYTRDGSRPGETHGEVYSGPIPIDTTTVIRAMAFKADWLASNVDTQTYLYAQHVIRQPKEIPGYPSPRTWLGGSAYAYHDYEMDPEVVNDPAYRDMIADALKAIPTMSIVANLQDLGTFYWGEGETPASMELIFPTIPAKNVQAECGVEPHSHNRMKRSLRLNFRAQYGDAKLRSSIFRDAPLNGESAADSVDKIVLRGGNNRSWARIWNPERTAYTMDQWFRDTQIGMSGIGSHGTFVHLYINGLYWGLYNPVERPDEWFASSYMGGMPVEWYSVSHGGSHGGDPTRWNYLKGTLVNKDMSDKANYTEIQQYLDVERFIDYIMLSWFMGMLDWPENNWWGANRNDPAGPFTYFGWDGEWSWKTTRGHNNGWVHPDFRSDKSGGTTIPALWHALRRNDDFLTLFADQAFKHLFHQGALTDANCRKRYMALNDFIRDAVVAESARWGDTCEGQGHPTRTRNVDWEFAVNETLGPGFMADNVPRFVASLRVENYYPSIDPPVFAIGGMERQGGYVSIPDTPLTLESNQTVWFTLDGTDPRLSVGNPNPHATCASSTVLPHSLQVKARAITANGEWSALNETVFAVGPVKENLRITEIMFHPADPNCEFIELQNIGTQAINLNLVKYTNGVDFTFGDMTLAPGGYTLVVQNAAAFAARYGAGLPIAGHYVGSLENKGERIILVDAIGTVIHDFEYKDGWYDITDGGGFSLTIIDAANPDPLAWGEKSGWRPSSVVRGSPGSGDSGIVPPPGAIVINEILSHSHDIAPDWIELYNTTADPINIGGWFLSDSNLDDTNRKKYEFATGTTIGGYGYKVFYQDQHFGNESDSGCHIPFALSEGGETVYLRSGLEGQLTGYAVEQDFGAAENGVAFGRYIKSTLDGGMDFVAMAQNSPHDLNSGPKVGPIVITEIMYNPNTTNTGDEYIEIKNISTAPIILQDAVGTETSPGVFRMDIVPWRFTEGIEFVFPVNTTIPAGGLLIVAKNPTALKAYFGAAIPGNVPVLGPFANDTSLSNGGEKIRLSRPGDQELGLDRFWIRAEQVNYDDEIPWPLEPDGTGKVLSRIAPTIYGNDVTNWQTANPTPGQ